MKKIIATFLCLAISSPCFALGRGEHFAPSQAQMQPPVVSYAQPHHRTSQRTKTLGVVAGLAGIAMIFSAIAD
jgi:hypothetical protein